MIKLSRRKQRGSLLILGCAALLGCSEDVTLFNQSFVNLFTGGVYPIAPGPDVGYVMVMVMNNTENGVEFIVTAESEETVAQLDAAGQVTAFQSAVLESDSASLVTDGIATTLGAVFDNTPVTWPPKGPGELAFADVQNVVNQLAVKQPELLAGREFIRLVRVLTIGLGPDLNAPASEDDGIIVPPPGTDQATTAGNIFPSNVNNALSYDVGTDPADFGNGDLVIFLALSNSTSVGGTSVVAGLIDGEAANVNSDSYIRNTFEILRREEGPISPPPAN